MTDANIVIECDDQNNIFAKNNKTLMKYKGYIPTYYNDSTKEIIKKNINSNNFVIELKPNVLILIFSNNNTTKTVDKLQNNIGCHQIIFLDEDLSMDLNIINTFDQEQSQLFKAMKFRIESLENRLIEIDKRLCVFEKEFEP